MRKGKARSEKNNGKKLTIPVRTRSPLEAFKMLEAGQPVDVMAGYYDKMGVLAEDFQMLDHIGKLEALNRYREIERENKSVLDKALSDKKEAERKLKEIELRNQIKKEIENEQNSKGNGQVSQ